MKVKLNKAAFNSLVHFNNNRCKECFDLLSFILLQYYYYYDFVDRVRFYVMHHRLAKRNEMEFHMITIIIIYVSSCEHTLKTQKHILK